MSIRRLYSFAIRLRDFNPSAVVRLVIFVFAVTSAGCAGIDDRGTRLVGPGPHAIGDLILSVRPSDGDVLTLFLENRGLHAVSISIRPDERIIDQQVTREKVKIGVDIVERCSVEDQTCWFEEVPVYDEVRHRVPVYSDISILPSSAILGPEESLGMKATFRNASEVVDEFKVRFRISLSLRDSTVASREWQYYSLYVSSRLFFQKSE